MLNFEINSIQIDKIKKITTEEKRFRIRNLEFFKAAGFSFYKSSFSTQETFAILPCPNTACPKFVVVDQPNVEPF